MLEGMHLCKNPTCGEVHGYSWTRPYDPAPHRVIEKRWQYCSIACAAAAGVYSVKEGFKYGLK